MNRLPESLDLTQGHGMMRLGPDMPDPVFFQFLLKPRRSPPVDILAAVVRQHLLRDPILRHGNPEDFKDMLRRLAAIHSHTGDIPGIIINVSDQIGCTTAQAKRMDIALPHLIGPGSFKESRCLDRTRRLFPGFGHQICFMQGLPDRLMAGFDEKQSLKKRRYSPAAKLRVIPLHRDRCRLRRFRNLPPTR